MPDSTSRLLAIMARLRDPVTGCDWDTAQTFATIAPYTIEEAYEVADAIQRGAMAELREELGDLLLQVVFHARMAEEQGLFSYQDVVTAICDKMESRHPHIFGAQTGGPDLARWEDQKAAERAARGHSSALDGVAQALPALMRAEKLQKRAARVGFDWPDPAEPSAKIVEELDELANATTDHDRLLEAGDLLFAAVNVVRSYGISAEDALRAGNAKFEGRFRQMEHLATADGQDFASLSLDEQEAYWQRAKAAERG
ncbi:nucleoside triphosphate pyrophosphohydrolase [Alteraurantiacibacter buctensis]|uniref:Nucleoside triphosphate pyrophosphohydrolase n=1 Tax=Alteraurantiacibacter buctensis TaxID=1503981 RepID=A0A844YYP6_9SPHN|nr:nucleoside triphosphate pyrophosphohydrolase [Alteraurantiacibacter buctensis]MXO72156.1 nucleoside triphosphate pyrophosphohydrolase [Alteraurantiacibacter buctensis]